MKNVCDATVEAQMENTLFIAISDHGGTPWDGKTGKPWNGKNATHGGWSDAEKFVTFAAVAKSVCKTSIQGMHVRDLAAIILYALGIEAPVFDECGWTSQIPVGLFDDPAISAYRDISHLIGVPHASGLV